MTTQAIIESGMTFGPYPEGRCFYHSARKTPSFEGGDISASPARAIDGAIVM